MSILLLSDDLMLSSQLAAAAQQNGQTVRTAPNLESLLSLCADDEAVHQVVLDLNVANIQPAAALAKLRNACPTDTTFLAVAPHVHTAKLEGARQAGFDRVLTRGQFHGSMRELFAE